MKLELSPLKLAKLTFGNKNSKKTMSIEEYNARNEVMNNFIRYFKVKIKTK